MSTVAVKIDDTHVVMAGDRQASQNHWGMHAVTKVWRIRDTLVGVVGEFGKAMRVVEWMREGSFKDNFPTEELKGGDFILLIWNGESLGTFDEQGFFVGVEETSFAVGTGAMAARGAMAAGMSAEGSIHIASQIDENTGMGTDTIRVAL